MPFFLFFFWEGGGTGREKGGWGLKLRDYQSKYSSKIPTRAELNLLVWMVLIPSLKQRSERERKIFQFGKPSHVTVTLSAISSAVAFSYESSMRWVSFFMMERGKAYQISIQFICTKGERRERYSCRSVNQNCDEALCLLD